MKMYRYTNNSYKLNCGLVLDAFLHPSRARTCDHLIMSQVSNSYNSPSSNHNVNICKIKGYELSASIPAIAQAMYGIYRTAKYDSESSPISYT